MQTRWSTCRGRWFFSSLKHTWQLLLVKFFHLTNVSSDLPPKSLPECPQHPGGRGMTLNAFLQSLKHMWQLLLLVTFVDWTKLIFCEEQTSDKHGTDRPTCGNSDLDIKIYIAITIYISVCVSHLVVVVLLFVWPKVNSEMTGVIKMF